MQSNSCKVCGGSDMNLLDGYYYCVECGTQDENVQERLVDTEAFIGLATKTRRARVRKPKENINMSPEWYKWHAYNFIIAGLADELIAAGAEPTVKTKILWIWTKYIKYFKAKEDLPKSHFTASEEDNTAQNKSNEDYNESDTNNINDNSSLSGDEDMAQERLMRMKATIKYISKGLIMSIFYIALNLDRSDIQLSHLQRYIKWEYVDIKHCTKYIPKDLNTKLIPGFRSFKLTCTEEYNTHRILRTVYALFRFLQLGRPLVPDIRKITEDIRKELSLPEDFKDLVTSLMHQYPTPFAKLSTCFHKKIVIPDYEVLCLAYYAVAFKLCFGLDDEYEVKLSEVVDKINNENNYPKSLKIGSSSDPTERLFSFKDWCEHMRVKKLMVCKHNLDMARLFKYEIDDHIFVEHMDKVPTKPLSLTNEIVKDILDKIPVHANIPVIPKSEFDLKFTPISSCVDVILDYIQDPDIRIILSEDFSQYSIDYATRKLRLVDETTDSKNVIKGINKNNKIIIHGNSVGEMTSEETIDSKMFYVRFCDENNIPESNNIKESQNMKENDLNDNNLKIANATDIDGALNDELKGINESKTLDASKLSINEVSKLEETIDNDQRTVTFVDYSNACIYDDDNKDDVKKAISSVYESGAFHNNDYFEDYADNYLLSPKNRTILDEEEIPENFDRNALISELVKKACDTYKITLPPPKADNAKAHRNQRKAQNRRRKMPAPDMLFGNLMSKNDSTIFKLLSSYYRNIQPNKSINEEAADENFESNIETSIRDDIEPTNDLNRDKTIEESDIDMSVNECEIEDEKFIKELEELESNEESEEEYVLPEIAEEQSDVDLDKAMEKILEKETKRCGEPPKKKIKVTEKEVIKTASNKKFLHPSAWGVKNFNYWTRHFLAVSFTKSFETHERFNFELHHNFPVNFVHMMEICCSVIDCSSFRLYKYIQNLEKCIIKRIKK